MPRLLLLGLALLLAAQAGAQTLLDAARDPLTGEPVVGVPGQTDRPAPDAVGGPELLTPQQHLGSGSTKLVRAFNGLTVYQDGIDLVVRIDTPTSGSERSRFRLPAQPADAVAVGTRLYLALRNNEGLYILDLANPDAPVRLGQLAGIDALAVAVSGTTAYVGRGSAGVLVVDVSDPATPTQIGAVDTPGSANGLDVSGTLLAVADGNVSAGPDIRLYDVTTPAAPSLLGTAEANGFATYAAFHNGRLFVTGAAGLLAFDVSNPAAPMLVGTSPAGGETTYEVVFTGTIAYVAGLAGLRVLDVSGAPTEIGSDDPGGQGLSVALGTGVGGVPVAFLADRFNGLRVYARGGPTPSPVGLYRTGGFSHKGVFAGGTRLYVTDLAGALRVFTSGTEPGAPLAEAGRVAVPANTQHVLVDGTRAFVTDANGAGSGLSVVDVSDPAAPAVLATLDFGPAYGMALDGTTLFVANGFGGLATFDVSGATPIPLDTFPLGANTVDVDVDPVAGVAYVVTLGGGMASLYVADPSDISQLDAEPGFGVLNAITLDDFSDIPRAFVADGQAGLRFVDVTDASILRSLSTTPTASQARDVASRAKATSFERLYTNVYVAEDFAGLRRFQVHPESNGTVDVTGTFASADRGIGVAVEPGSVSQGEIRRVALMAGEVGVYVFWDGFPVAASPGASLGELSVEPVAPNPVRGAAMVRYRTDAPGAATVEVLDGLGRRVAVLAEGAHAAGPHSVRLDASALPAGVYVVRVVQGDAHATTRLTVVR